MRYKRINEDKIINLVAHFPAVVVTGARQVGKTTLLRNIFPGYSYVNLDSFQQAELAENQPEQFLKQNPPPLVVDEVQYAPKLFRHVKQVIDKQRDLNGQFVLTGSQKFPLMREVSDSLAGRVALVELETLCSQELKEELVATVKRRGPAYILSRGMFPQLWEDSQIPSDDYYLSYLSTYVERDVRQLLNVNSLRDFHRFMRAAAIRNGSLLNKTELAKDVGVSTKTISDWLSVLEASNQIILLEPYFSNIGKRLVKSPRLFFNDTGLLCYLLGLGEEALSNYTGIGFIWESYVFAELRKLRAAYVPRTQFWFYRDNSGKEVDLLLDYDGLLDLFEIKWTELVSQQHEKTLLEVKQILENKTRQWGVISRADTDSVTRHGSQVLNGFSLKPWNVK